MNIKDYLHLYLGCECQVEKSDLKWTLTAVQSITNICVLRNNINSRTGVWLSMNKFKLILRPLSDMTEDECGDVYTISRDRILHESSQEFHVIKNKNGFIIHRLDFLGEPLMFGFNGQIYSVVEDGNKKHIEPVRNQHHITSYLLSKQFDLFGLIEYGLAIDKTTLNK